ncbi:hypothetical protein M9Y10_031883 [Tritrichomonas musculus]|uniref:Uncharacterized protein n=1 Tax=Tritrichomonas musculus TaxID=1915356 RepID=A0ABR2H010_9EUKA
MLQEPNVQVIKINTQNEKNIKTTLMTYAIIQLPSNQSSINIYFDKNFSPSFQGLINHDVFKSNDEAFELISLNSNLLFFPNTNLEQITGKAIAGLIKKQTGIYLLLINDAVPIIFQDQEFFYQVKTFEVVPLNIVKKDSNEKFPKKYNVEGYFYSFSSNILSFQKHKKNKYYSYFHSIQKPFSRLQANVCPFIINGYIAKQNITNIFEILFVCRHSVPSKSNESGINQDGITLNQSEVEMVVSEKVNDGKKISFFTVTFGDMPFEYRIKDEKGKSLKTEEFDIPFRNSPNLILNLLGNQHERIKDDIYFIDASDKNNLNTQMRKTVSFLSGVFHAHYISVNFNIETPKKRLFTQIYTAFPAIKLRDQLILDDGNTYFLNDSNQIFYISSNIEFNAEFVSFLLICKAFASLAPEHPSTESDIFKLIAPFLPNFVDPTKKNDSSILNKLFAIRPDKNSNNTKEKDKETNFTAPENLERCVSLFPTATIVDPTNVDHQILNAANPISYFYRSPEKPIIISLTEICRITSIIFSPPRKNKTDLETNSFDIFPSTVSIFGGLCLNKMFPIVENLSISWNTETLFRIDSTDSSDEYYSTDFAYSKYGKVLFMSFHFKSPFKAFYVPNIQVFSNGKETSRIPKKIQNKTVSLKNVNNNDQFNFIQSELQRITNDESIPIFIFKDTNKIKDLIRLNTYFNTIPKKGEFEYHNFHNFSDVLKDRELKMMDLNYPFLSEKHTMETNLIKAYSPESTYIPILLVSGPPLFEYVIGRGRNITKLPIFEPKENVVIVKLVLLQSYNVNSIEIRCNHPLLLEFMNNHSKRFKFLPPGNEQELSLTDCQRVFDIKIVGNPISISFLGFRPNSNRFSYEIGVGITESSGEKDNDSTVSLKYKEAQGFFENSELVIKGDPKKFIGIRFKPPYGVLPRVLLFDDKFTLYFKCNPNAAFFFPEIVTCSKIKVFCQGTSNNQKFSFPVSLFEVLDKQNDENLTFQDIINKKPTQIVCSTNAQKRYF